MDTLLQDLRFGVKLLWKEKALSLTVLLTLAICVGANTTIFSVIHTVLLEPLPFSQPDRLVRAPGRQSVAAGRERHRPHRLGMRTEDP